MSKVLQAAAEKRINMKGTNHGILVSSVNCQNTYAHHRLAHHTGVVKHEWNNIVTPAMSATGRLRLLLHHGIYFQRQQPGSSSGRCRAYHGQSSLFVATITPSLKTSRL